MKIFTSLTMEPALDTNKFDSKFNDYFINVSQNLKNLGKTNQFQEYLKTPSEQACF